MNLVKALFLTFVLLSPLGAIATESVNINAADAETLAANLEGVGLQKARAIVAYREQQGAFTSVDEITAVRGIGPSTLEKNRSKLVVGGNE